MERTRVRPNVNERSNPSRVRCGGDDFSKTRRLRSPQLALERFDPSVNNSSVTSGDARTLSFLVLRKPDRCFLGTRGVNVLSPEDLHVHSKRPSGRSIIKLQASQRRARGFSVPGLFEKSSSSDIRKFTFVVKTKGA